VFNEHYTQTEAIPIYLVV